MQIWADTAFRIGSSHAVCEDYACAAGDMVALSDGCSGGENTDVGARLLSLVALRLAVDATDISQIGRQAAIVAKSLAGILPTGRNSLLATLLVAGVAEDGFYASCWGDGFVLFLVEKRWSGWRISWAGERPFYPIYPESEWVALGGAHRIGDPGGHCFMGRTRFHARDKAATGVVLLSDGFSSFYDAERRPVPEEHVFDELLKFKLVGPDFVQRRMSAFQRRCAKLGWTHYDDISMAVIKEAA